MSEFKKLYDAVFPVVYRIAWRIAGSEDAAEDLCQEAFFKIYEKEMLFPNLDEAKFWLIRVVKNAALNYAKRKQREMQVYQKAFHEDSREQISGETELVQKELRDDIQEAMRKLPGNLREVLALKEWGDFNYKEIGRILGISEGNVKVRVFRAREKLQELLSGLLLDSPNSKGDSELKSFGDFKLISEGDLRSISEGGLHPSSEGGLHRDKNEYKKRGQNVS